MHSFKINHWQPQPSDDEKILAIHALENGSILFFPQLSFQMQPQEIRFLSDVYADPRKKNISYDPLNEQMKGSRGSAFDQEQLQAMMSRFAESAQKLVVTLLPHYQSTLQIGRTSFRPAEILGRKSSLRKDDTRLHVDAFPANPNQGRRILRVFANINPRGENRVWRVGEPFETMANRYLSKIKAPFPGSAQILKMLGLTKSLRTPYDHIMLQIHDLMKMDASYQKTAHQQEIRFPSQSSWIVFTDLVSHAAMSGQCALEQTFYLPVAGMANALSSPLKILERLLDSRKLA